MLKRLLIANRGEIAVRVARTARRLGAEVVSVYSDADAGALHLRDTDAAVRIGPALAAESYLALERIIDAARENGCDAIHPGYGFLSENADFAQAVTQAGLVFVGPRAETIAALGDKARAKYLMQAAGVPIVPGSSMASEDVCEISRQAKALGFPVLLKPSAGGGGKGMQIVRTPAALQDAARQAIRLAATNFKDGRLIVERYIETPRHVEVQVFGDTQGNVVHLFERECSLQRRHQKVIEEAPAPALDDDVRSRLLSAAVRGAQAVGYINAGTFEFILGAGGEFYFLEVNTRLQVEHPVTEEITGLDLVEWQLRVASGEPLPLRQDEIRACGHAFEARVYAEDATDDFRPAPGTAHVVRWPDGIRVDAAIESGGIVSPFYDPMIAKLITHGRDRSEALRMLRAAVGESVVLGLTTNLGLLAGIARDPAVGEGRIHTKYLDQHLIRLTEGGAAGEALACAAAIDVFANVGAAPAWPWADPGSLLDRACLLPSAPGGMLSYWIDGKSDDARVAALARNTGASNICTVIVGDAAFDVSVASPVAGEYCGTVAGRRWSALDMGSAFELSVGGVRHVVERYAARDPSSVQAAGAAVAPMPGVVVALLVKVGDRVAAGDVVAIVEAMKMENRVASAADGRVVALNCALRDMVSAGQLLVSIEADGG